MELTEKADKKFKWSAIPEFCGKWLAAALFLMILAQTAHLLFRGEVYYPNKNCLTRSEERRVGKECRSRWSPYH